MKSGHSYNTVTDTSHPKHKLVKALKAKGYSNFELIYASHWSSDAGWILEGIVFANVFHGWLGYTIKSALKSIEDNITPYSTEPSIYTK